MSQYILIGTTPPLLASEVQIHISSVTPFLKLPQLDLPKVSVLLFLVIHISLLIVNPFLMFHFLMFHFLYCFSWCIRYQSWLQFSPKRSNDSTTHEKGNFQYDLCKAIFFDITIRRLIKTHLVCISLQTHWALYDNQGQSSDVHILYFLLLFSYQHVNFQKQMTALPLSVKSEEVHQEFAEKREQTEAGELLSPSLKSHFILGISTFS